MSKFMDTLGDLSGSGSDSEKEEDPAENITVQPASKKKRATALEPAPEELERLGYKSGPSILYVPEPQSEAEPNWECPCKAWTPSMVTQRTKGVPSFIIIGGTNVFRSRGKGAKEDAEPAEETFQEREHTRNAAGGGLDETARLQRLAQEQARRVREEAREEHARLAAERRLTFKQKEKRKRELGQQQGGKGNYVEEEKRIARQFGVYSGFDS